MNESAKICVAILGGLLFAAPGAVGAPVTMHEQALPAASDAEPRSGLTQADARTRARVSQAYGQLPLLFEANQGQSAPEVRFLSRGQRHTLFLTATEAVMVMRSAASEQPAPHVLRMQLVGANLAPRMEGLEPFAGRSHYLIGNDPARWRTEIPHYGRVKYEAVYRGIDLVFHSAGRRLEYDFVVAPGADPEAIELRFEGATAAAIDTAGDLVLSVAGGELRFGRPVIYQEAAGARAPVAGRYVLRGPDAGGAPRVAFEVGPYDRARPLVIDPILFYSSFLGNHGDGFIAGVAVDSAGNAYVTGATSTADFPTVNPIDATLDGRLDVFVTKLNAAGTALIYSTFLGGGGEDTGRAIAVDGAGNAYITGQTLSANFPTLNAIQPMSGGSPDAFVAKINAAGTALVYSTYLGGSDTEFGLGIAADGAGNAYVTGFTGSGNFRTQNPIQPMLGGGLDAFVTKLDASGTVVVYSTFLGGSGGDVGNAIALDVAGNAYVTGDTFSDDFPTVNAFKATRTGSDAFVTKVNAAGTALVYSTYLGGGGSEFGNGIAVDAAGSAYIAGTTLSADFPPATALQLGPGGGQDGFVVKFNTAGTALVYSTRLGGSSVEFVTGIGVDSAGNAYVTGSTLSANFPTLNSLQPRFPTGSDAFVAKLDATGTAPVYVTLLGGEGNESIAGIAVDRAGNAYVVGVTRSADFPTTATAFQDTPGAGFLDPVIAKIGDVASPLDEFVSRFYLRVLGRLPDPAGAAAWVGFIRANCNAAAFGVIANGFFDSLEFRTVRPHSLPGLVTLLYHTFLDRRPDAGGLAGWAGLLRQARLAVALEGFIPSQEFQQLLPDRTNRAAVTAVVTRLYEEILERAPDPTGLAGFVDLIVATGNLELAAGNFLASPEFEARSQTARDYVTTLYRTFLGREPDPAGLEAWEGILRTALLDVIELGFVPSPEFQGLIPQVCS